MENLRKAGKFVLTAACTLLFLLIVISKLTDGGLEGIGRGMGIGIIIFSIISGLTAAFYKDEDEGKEEGNR